MRGRILSFPGDDPGTTVGRVFIPQHALTLDGTLVCVFLYGAYGPDAERALSDVEVTNILINGLRYRGNDATTRSVR